MPRTSWLLSLTILAAWLAAASAQTPLSREPAGLPPVPAPPVASSPLAPALVSPPAPPAPEPVSPLPTSPVLAPPVPTAPAPVPAATPAVPEVAASTPKPVSPTAPTRLATPRETLKTLYFSITAYDFRPELIQDAVSCLEQAPGETRDLAGAAKLTVQLEAILRTLCLPVNAVPDSAATDAVVVYDDDDIKIALRRGSDGGWRFDHNTVEQIPAMYRTVLVRHKGIAAQRTGLREEYTDPSATMRRFMIDSITGDFYAAAQALDLSRLPSDQRADRGPVLAQQLMYVIQHRGWIFFQELPNTPDSLPYTWHADRTGRIVLDRVRCCDGKEAWLFTKNTVKNLEAMYQAALQTVPDFRYVQLGRVVPAVAAGVGATGAQRPASVPAQFGSPRALLQNFFRVIDEVEGDNRRQAETTAFLDLNAIPAADRAAVGVKLAGKLDAVLRKLQIDLAAIPDSWNAPAQYLGKERGIRVELARQRDGFWRFSPATVADIPQFFDTLANQKQADAARTGHQESARDTMVSFLADCNHHRDAKAAQCLDLSELHPSVREEGGRVLAFKLKYVIDRINRVYPQEIPDEPEGSRYVFHSGEDGRIVIARKAEGAAKGKWFFTSETVEQIEAMFNAVFGDPPHPSLQGATLREPTPLDMPGVWVRQNLPEWATLPAGGLQLYQWLGLAAILVLSWVAIKVSLTCLQCIGVWVLQRCGSKLTMAFVNAKLRPLTWLCTCWLFFQGPIWLDLPLPWLNSIMPARTFLTAGLLGWLGFQLIDLLMAVYMNSELLRPHRSLSDMIVPVSMRFLKGGVLIMVIGYVVYHVGHGDSLVQFFAGLGMAGFAASLAAQDILKSFFGTLLLIGERSFMIGDRIRVAGTEGIVEQVGFRSTRLRTADGTLITVPNATISSASIDNRGVDIVRSNALALSLGNEFPVGRIVTLRDRLQAWLCEYPAVDPNRTNVTIELNRERGVELLVNYTLQDAQDVDEKATRREITYAVLQMVQEAKSGSTAIGARPELRRAA